MCAVLWAIGVIFFRLAVKGIPAIEMALFKNSFSMILFLISWLLLPQTGEHTPLARSDILILIGSGILGIAIGDTLFLYSLKILGAGRNAIIGCLFSPFVLILSFIFLGERFTLFQAVGFLTILAGIFLAVYQKPDHKLTKDQLIRGSIIGVLGIFFMSTGMVTTKPVLEDASPLTVATIRIFGGVLGITVFTLVSGRYKRSLEVFRGPIPWKVMSLGAFIGSYLALFAWIVGFKYTSATIASILNQTSVFFILILAAIVLKEQLTLPKIAGALLGFIGVGLILLHA